MHKLRFLKLKGKNSPLDTAFEWNSVWNNSEYWAKWDGSGEASGWKNGRGYGRAEGHGYSYLFPESKGCGSAAAFCSEHGFGLGYDPHLRPECEAENMLAYKLLHADIEKDDKLQERIRRIRMDLFHKTAKKLEEKKMEERNFISLVLTIAFIAIFILVCLV